MKTHRKNMIRPKPTSSASCWLVTHRYRLLAVLVLCNDRLELLDLALSFRVMGFASLRQFILQIDRESLAVGKQTCTDQLRLCLLHGHSDFLVMALLHLNLVGGLLHIAQGWTMRCSARETAPALVTLTIVMLSLQAFKLQCGTVSIRCPEAANHAARNTHVLPSWLDHAHVQWLWRAPWTRRDQT